MNKQNKNVTGVVLSGNINNVCNLLKFIKNQLAIHGKTKLVDLLGVVKSEN